MPQYQRQEALNQAFYALQLLADYIPEWKNMDDGRRAIFLSAGERENIRANSNQATRDNLVSEVINDVLKAFTAIKSEAEKSGRLDTLARYQVGKLSPEQLAQALHDDPKRLAEMADQIHNLASASQGGEMDTSHYSPPRTAPRISADRIGHAMMLGKPFHVEPYKAGQSSLPELQKEHYRYVLEFTKHHTDNQALLMTARFKAALGDIAEVDVGTKNGHAFVALSPKGGSFTAQELFAIADRAEAANTFQYFRSKPGDDGSFIQRRPPTK